jgi:hypothetical protein
LVSTPRPASCWKTESKAHAPIEVAPNREPRGSIATLIVDSTGSQVATEKVARIVLNGDNNTSHTFCHFGKLFGIEFCELPPGSMFSKLPKT